MRDYAKMIETVRVLREEFGNKEFTSNDYFAKTHSMNDVYCTAKVCNTNNYMVKKVREEDFIGKDNKGKKFIGTRYYYEVNDNFLNDMRKETKNDIETLKAEIENAYERIRSAEKRISEKQNLIAVLEQI